MDENLLSLLEELSLRSCSEDEHYSRIDNNYQSSSNNSASSNVSSPTYEQLANNLPEEDLELKNAVSSLFQDLNHSSQDGYDKTKLMVALLGNIDLVTCAVKKINQLVTLGKRMEQIYRTYYVNPSVHLDLDEIAALITAFSDVYNTESYARQVNVSRVYQAYCKKLVDIYNQRMSETGQDEDRMIT